MSGEAVPGAAHEDRRLGRVVAVVSALVMLGVGAVVVVWRAQPSRPAPSTSTRAEQLVSSARHRFGAVPELVAASDLVVVGRVVGDEQGRVFGETAAGGGPDAAIRSHVLTVEVDRVLVGGTAAAPGTVVLVEEEHSLADGTPVVVDGMRPGQVGDRGVFFLAAGGDPEFPAFALVNAQGRYLFAGRDRLTGGDRTDALVRKVESLGAAKLQESVSARA